jgi:hypothetical protein
MSRRLISECLPPWIPTSLPSWLFWHDNSLNQGHMKPATVATSMEIEWNNCGQIMSNPWALLTTGFGRLSFWPIATSEFQTRLRMHPQKKRDILRGLRSFHKAQNRKIRYLPLVSVNTHANHPALPQNCAIMWVILTTSPAPSIHSRDTTQGLDTQRTSQTVIIRVCHFR